MCLCVRASGGKKNKIKEKEHHYERNKTDRIGIAVEHPASRGLGICISLVLTMFKEIMSDIKAPCWLSWLLDRSEEKERDCDYCLLPTSSSFSRDSQH